jgi:hypothetical protein
VTALDIAGLPTAVFGSGVAQHASLTAWDAAIRGSRATTRRIGFVSLSAGSGATTLALEAMRLLSARRAEPVLAVDVTGDPQGLGARLGAGITPPSDVRGTARTSAEAITGLVPAAGGFVLRPEVDEGPVGAWLAEAAPIARFFEVAITDFGARHPLVDLASSAALCDVLCLVSDAGRSAAEYSRALAPAIAALPEAPRPVLALVDHARRGDAVARILDADAAPTIHIPFDRGLRAGRSAASLPARRALLHLAAVLTAGGGVAA